MHAAFLAVALVDPKDGGFVGALCVDTALRGADHKRVSMMDFHAVSHAVAALAPALSHVARTAIPASVTVRARPRADSSSRGGVGLVSFSSPGRLSEPRGLSLPAFSGGSPARPG